MLVELIPGLIPELEEIIIDYKNQVEITAYKEKCEKILTHWQDKYERERAKNRCICHCYDQTVKNTAIILGTLLGGAIIITLIVILVPRPNYGGDNF